MTGIENARKRLENKVPDQFIINDLLEETLFTHNHLLSQKDIYDMAFNFCRELKIGVSEAEKFKEFYPSKFMLETDKVYHGDCRNILPLCNSLKPKGIITDFPYGINFQSNMRVKSEKFAQILNDEKPFIDKWIRQSYKILADNTFFISFYRWDFQEELFDEIQSAGFKIKSQLVWIKGGGGIGDLAGSPIEGHENAVFAVKGNYKLPNGRPSNIYQSNKVSSYHIIHPNEKPLWLMQGLIRDYTSKGDLIIDPFSGAGTVCAAAVSEGRRGIGIELDDRYVPHINCNYIEYGNKRIIENKKNSNKLF